MHELIAEYFASVYTGSEVAQLGFHLLVHGSGLSKCGCSHPMQCIRYVHILPEESWLAGIPGGIENRGWCPQETGPQAWLCSFWLCDSGGGSSTLRPLDAVNEKSWVRSLDYSDSSFQGL